MRKKVLITSALPYANGPLHFGHVAGAYLPADCYARFERLQGNDVLYISGSDEHGVAITLSADLSGRTPQEQVDLFHDLHRKFFSQMNFSFDHFSRTTKSGHAKLTQQFFHDLWNNGYIEEKWVEQLFSIEENRFLADRYVVGTCPRCQFSQARGDECQKCGASYEAMDLKEPRSKISDSSLILKESKQWFLRFDLFKDCLRNWLEGKTWKPNVMNFAKSYIEGLKPRAITRDGHWGIPVPLPQAEGKVFYVWFDAPIGYISATQDWAELQGKKEAWKDFWFDADTIYVQFIGKDNIPFHAIFFPCMIMGQNQSYKLVDQLPANEFLNLEGRRFSKSEGWTIDLGHFYHHFTADQIRYTLAANAPENQDSEFTWKDFQIRCNSDLLGKYGNLIHRVLTFLQRQTQGKIPVNGVLKKIDEEFVYRTKELMIEVREAYRAFHLRRAASLIMEIAHIGNVYFDQKKPWVLCKASTSLSDLETTLYCSLQHLHLLALASSPIIPESAQMLWEMLGNSSSLEKENWNEVLDRELLVPGSLPTPHVLFTTVEDALILEEEQKLRKSIFHN